MLIDTTHSPRSTTRPKVRCNVFALLLSFLAPTIRYSVAPCNTKFMCVSIAINEPIIYRSPFVDTRTSCFKYLFNLLLLLG
jgi:hypothetical protein